MFTETQIKEMREVYVNSPKKEQMQHCADQMYRFANLAQKGNDFRSAQFGYNMGRLQEMLCPDVILWKHYEPLIIEQNWQAIMNNVIEMIEKIGMNQPNTELINRL
jgi:hypothetical protein